MIRLIDGPSGRTYTYRQLQSMIHRFGAGLAAASLSQQQQCRVRI